MLISMLLIDNKVQRIHSYDINKINIIKLGPPNFQVYEYIYKYHKIYDIPMDYALNCAREETGYRGFYHWTYNPYQISTADAYGPMQVQLPTAQDMTDIPVTVNKILYDIEFNIETSFKYKRWLMDEFLPYKYKEWKYVYTAYNRGLKKYKSTNIYAKNITGI